MLAKFRSAVSKSRVRQRELDRRRHAQRRTLRAEPLEGRLLLSGDSWVLPTGIPNQASGNTTFPVAADDAGSVYLGATRKDGSATDPDIRLTKYLSDGTLAWTNDIRLPGRQVIRDVAVVSDDGVYIVGFFDGTVNLDPAGGTAGILQSRGGDDAYLAKYSIADGAFLWAHQWGGAGTDWLRGIAVSGDSIFVTGNTEISVRNKVQANHLVASVSSDNVPRWEKTVGPIGGCPTDIAVFTPTAATTNVYISGTWESGGYVKKLTETVDGKDAVLGWTYDLGANISMAGWGGIAVGDGNPLPSLYVLTQGSGTSLLKISDTGDIGNFVWSTSMDAYPWGVTVDGTTAYVTGYFTEQWDFDQQAVVNGDLLTSRGSNDGFLARYDTENGRLQAAQRMGGTAFDGWYSVAVGNDHVYAGGILRSTNGDFPAGGPGEMSAFVPADPQGEVFVMQLDTAAPIVHVAETDITVGENTLVTLAATTSAGTITWYESGFVLGTGNELPVTLSLGTHEISAIATDDAERIGMAGVVVNVTPPATLAINDVTKAEGRRGTTTFTFTVTRSGDTSGSASVSYATAPGTALAGSDYTATSGTLSFAAGVTSRTINVSVIGDRTAEPDETFFVNLITAVGGTIVNGQGLGTIVNDDGAALMAALGEQTGGQIVTLDQVQQLMPRRVAGVESASPQPSVRLGGRVAEVESSSVQPSVRIADDYRWARANHRQTKVDDLFAQWESDPLQLLSFPDLGM